MGDNALPANAAEATDMALTGLRFLASSDPTARPASVQAEILRALEQANAAGVAARAYCLAAFTAGQGYSEDADYSPRAWLIHQTGITRGAAAPRPRGAPPPPEEGGPPPPRGPPGRGGRPGRRHHPQRVDRRGDLPVE